MPTCFVIQPFDAGPFDLRYDEVLCPAIEAAGFTPYRVDRDPSVVVPIDQIEDEIRKADAVVAEISIDNPNVWFELGFAIASGHDPVMVCSEERLSGGFPFDIQHRAVVTYRTESKSSFDDLAARVIARLQATAVRSVALSRISSPLATVSELQQFETALMVIVFESTVDPGAQLASWELRRAMEHAGFTDAACKLAILSLRQRGLLHHEVRLDRDEEEYAVYSLTDEGEAWTVNNQEMLRIRRPGRAEPIAYDMDEEPF